MTDEDIWDLVIERAYPSIKYRLPYSELTLPERKLLIVKRSCMLNDFEKGSKESEEIMLETLVKRFCVTKRMTSLRRKVVKYNAILSLDEDVEDLMDLMRALTVARKYRDLSIENKENILNSIRHAAYVIRIKTVGNNVSWDGNKKCSE